MTKERIPTPPKGDEIDFKKQQETWRNEYSPAEGSEYEQPAGSEWHPRTGDEIKQNEAAPDFNYNKEIDRTLGQQEGGTFRGAARGWGRNPGGSSRRAIDVSNYSGVQDVFARNTGQKRKKELIEEEVNYTLMKHPDVDARDIEAALQEDGAVLLSGAVVSEKMSRIAEDLVKTIHGVDVVRNELRVTGVQGVGTA